MNDLSPTADLNDACRSVAVYMGSSRGVNPAYAAAAQALGRLLANNGLRLVYGGGHVGLMGITADAVLANGGTVLGVITERLKDMEVGHDRLTELAVVPGMHERKALMVDEADAFVALPGGFGTMDEFFEVVTWAQLRIHSKPCGLLNINGYFDSLLEFMRHSVNEEFVQGHHFDNLIIAKSAEELLAGFARQYANPPTQIDKRTDR